MKLELPLLAWLLGDWNVATPLLPLAMLALPLTRPLQRPATVAPATALPLASRTVTAALARAFRPLFTVRLRPMSATFMSTSSAGALAVITRLREAVRPLLSVVHP